MANVHNKASSTGQRQCSSNNFRPDFYLSDTKEAATGHTAKQANPVLYGQDAAQRTIDWVHHSAEYRADARTFDHDGGLKRAARLADVVDAADMAMDRDQSDKSRVSRHQSRCQQGGVAGDDLQGVGAWVKKGSRG